MLQSGQRISKRYLYPSTSRRRASRWHRNPAGASCATGRSDFACNNPPFARTAHDKRQHLKTTRAEITLAGDASTCASDCLRLCSRFNYLSSFLAVGTFHCFVKNQDCASYSTPLAAHRRGNGNRSGIISTVLTLSCIKGFAPRCNRRL